jgi:perosamine synthetase
MRIPFHRPYITDDEIAAVADSMRRGWLTMGEKTVEFEQRFSGHLGASHSIAVNSGTAALHLALCCIGLDRDDEVIVPATTFTATAEVVRYFNARPVMADIDRGTHCIDPETMARSITPRTKAVIPVHYSGQPCDMDEILDIARGSNIAVIEDAAHALPASYRRRPVGTLGDITCFSFYATKTLTTGEGGMAVTEKGPWADLMRTLRLHGISRDAWKRYTASGTWRYDVEFAGYKYNMTDIAAAMGIEQLKKIAAMQKMREHIASRYSAAFNDCEGVIPYVVKPDRETAWHLYPLRLNLDALTISRDEFIDRLNDKGVSTSVHFIPLYRFTYYRTMGFTPDNYPESEWAFNRTLSLPIFPGMTEEEIDHVIESVLDLIAACSR